MTNLNIDVETFSVEDIKSGVHKYASGAELLLFAYSYDDGPVQVVDIAQGEEIPGFIVDALFDKKVIKKAWNAAFEIEILENFLMCELPLSQWSCTMVRSARCGYPLSLDAAAKAVGLPVEKDASGKRLINLFSVPRKPTKTNPAERVYPQDEPEKWEEFKRYNKQDVVVEKHLDAFFSQYPETTVFEQKMYVLDRKINKRGLELDLPLIRKAVQFDEEYKARLFDEAKRLTGLENPNSVDQLKGWLEEKTGVVWKDLNKDVLRFALEESVVPFAERVTYARGSKGYEDFMKEPINARKYGKPDVEKPEEVTVVESDGSVQGFRQSLEVKRVLELRKELSNTSVRKYVTMLKAELHGRIYDTIQFYGAARTGRNAGRIIQPQNLPRVYMSDEELDLARNIVKFGDLETLSMCFDSVSSVLSQLIRTAIIAKEGKILKVTDLSAIEARILAWYADEKHVLDVFRSHGKIYEATAAMMFKVPFESVTKESEMRQRGKVASLACIAEGSLVLTDRGLVPIERVSVSHKLWDGENWVSHDGVIYKGFKNTITYEGLQATEDHLVWVKGKKGPVPFKLAAESGQDLLQSGAGRDAIRVGSDNLCREEVYKGLVRPICSGEMRGLRKKRMGSFCKPETRALKRVPKLLNTRKVTSQIIQKAYRRKTEMLESEGCRLPKLRGEGYKVQIPNRFRSGDIYVGELRRPFFKPNVYRPDRQQFALPKRQSTLCKSDREFVEQKKYCSPFLGSDGLAVLEKCCSSVPFTRVVSTGDTVQSLRGRNIQKKKLAFDKKEARVFDILNSGPLNRFTVSNVLVHNCGYQGSVGALSAMDADRKIPDEDKPGLVKAWREAHPNIVRFWYKTQDCAVKALTNPGEKVPLAKGAYFVTRKDALLFYLPSGRYLMYPKAGLKEGRFGLVVTFWGVDQKINKWCKQETYGGSLVENLVQATARDVLMEGMYNMTKAGYDLVTNVHDETVAETDEGFGSLEEIERLMCDMPEWAEGLPLAAAGFESYYYKK